VSVFANPQYVTSAKREVEPQAAEGVASYRTYLGEQGFRFASLPGSELEAGLLRSIYGDDVVVAHVGAQATEERFKSTDGHSAAVIHLATHAFIDSHVPERSAVVFTLDDDPTEDGLLTMREITSLRFGGSVVVLSACDTAGDRIVTTEGLHGLARAFLAAGASAVVATLWPVQDLSTAEFMKHLHTALAAGETASAAMATARRKLLGSADPRFRTPRAWAPFVLIGDGDVRLSLGRSNHPAEANSEVGP
jgi:CHAT domain-containing protein